MKKLIYSALLIMAGFVSFTSCSDDDEADKFPALNKTSFNLENIGEKDTLFTVDNGRYYLERVVVHSASRVVGETSLKKQEKTLKNGKDVIGTVEYSDGEVSRIVANDWFELKKINVNGHKKAYEVIRTGNNPSQLKATLLVWDEAPLEVAIQ